MMIDYIDYERRLSAREHFCLYRFYQRTTGDNRDYQNFHLSADLVESYNQSPPDVKADLERCLNQDPLYRKFEQAFQHEPWKYEKPVLWNDRYHTPYFIEQLEKSHAFEVFIDSEFKNRGFDLGLYYGRDAQYSGETAAGIEIKYDARSEETHNFYIEYQERMQNTGAWVDSGILKKDNSRFYLFGTMNSYVIFSRHDLLDCYEKVMAGSHPGLRLVNEVNHGTSKGFIIMPPVWQKLSLQIDTVIAKLQGKLR